MADDDVRKCMREFCDEPRWIDPVKGETVLCHEHVQEVFRGERRAPPLRRNIDYVATSRKSLLWWPAEADGVTPPKEGPSPARLDPAEVIDLVRDHITKRRPG